MRVALKAQGMVGADADEVVHIGPEGDLAGIALPLHGHLDRDEWCIFHRNADPLDRGDEHVALGIPP
jgi:hypothetical protein